MEELIRRADCHFLEVPYDTGQEIRDETEEIVDKLITQFEYDWDYNHIKEFAYAIILKCQNFIDSAPTVGNLPAWRCPECHTDFIDYDYEFCPNCGIKINRNFIEDKEENYCE